jgi:Pyridoxamine 5'-phosphate oxidase
MTLDEFLDDVPTGVLATTRPNGSVRQSAVYFLRERISLYISTEPSRHKALDIARTGHASICVIGHQPPYPSVTLEGPAALLTSGTGAITARIFARISGGDPTPLSDADVAALGRLLIRIEIARIYGATYLSTAKAADA